MNRKQHRTETSELRGEGRWQGTGKSQGRRKHNQDKLYGENYLFSIKGRKGRNHNCDCVAYAQHVQGVYEV